MKNVLISLSICLLFSAIANSQETTFKMTDNIPIDPKVKIGVLENGLTYYIRENSLPQNRAEFFLVVNAGAILEDDDQDGLAHFCEHMAFNGTQNFKKHDIINYLQSVGMKFGPEINAFTNQDVTNYMLQKVPTDVAASTDTALLILYDWASGVSYEPQEIDNERGVIHEEWRTRMSAGRRTSIETNKIVFAGSKYAERTVIGDTMVIDHAPYEAFTRFYNDWYRPDLQAIIAIGDFKMEDMEAKIRSLFSKLPKRENPKERKNYEVPDHDETRIAIVTDEEARNIQVKVMYKHDPVKDKSTLNYLREEMKARLFSQMLNSRLSEYSQKANPPYTWAWSNNGSICRTKEAFQCVAMTKNDAIERSLEILLTENKRAMNYGFTETEFERAKMETIKWYERSYKERDKNKSSNYTWSYYSHFLEQRPIPGIEFSYSFAVKVLPEISLAEVNALAKDWITDKNKVIVISGPETENVNIPDEKRVNEILQEVEKKEIKAYEDIIVDQPLVAKKPAAGKIVSETRDEKDQYTEYKLSNGATVVVKQTNFKEDEIQFRAFSLGGTSLYSQADDVSSNIADAVASESGLGPYDEIQMKRYLSGKIVNLSASISELTEEMYGSTRPKDFETLLEMVYATFTNPRFDKTDFEKYIEKQKVWLENRQLDPQTSFQDTITATMAQYHPRQRPWSMELYNEADYNRVSQIFKERFNDGSDFTFMFVGNVDMEVAKPLIETYIGGLPSLNKNEKWNDLNIRKPVGKIEKVVKNHMQVPKSTVYIAYTGEFEYNPKNKIILAALNDILDVRYTETIREEQGGTYGVSVYTYSSKYPVEDYQMNIRFDCDPNKADMLTEIVYSEIDKIKKDGPKPVDLENFKKNKMKEREEQQIENRYWISKLRSKYIYGISISDEEFKSIIDDLSVEVLKEAANKYINHNNQVKVIFRPLEQ